MVAFRRALASTIPQILRNNQASLTTHKPVYRLLYRSKQRGYLKLDLVLGKWVEDHIPSMDESGIKWLVHVLDLEYPDLWKWLSCQEQPPEAANNNPVVNNLDNLASPETRAIPGQPWVRGWDLGRLQKRSRHPYYWQPVPKLKEFLVA